MPSRAVPGSILRPAPRPRFAAPAAPRPSTQEQQARPTPAALDDRIRRASRLGLKLSDVPSLTASPGTPGSRLQRAQIKVEDLDLRVVQVYQKLSAPVLRLIRDTPEESFATFYSLEPQAQIVFLRSLEMMARQLLSGATDQSRQTLMLEGGSTSARQSRPSLQSLYDNFMDLNPTFLGELLNLATGGTATIRSFTAEGMSQTITITGGLQSLAGPGLLALNAPETSSGALMIGGNGGRGGRGMPLPLSSRGSRSGSPSLTSGPSALLAASGGMATQIKVGRFARAALDLLKDWSSLDPEARAQRMVTAANLELAEAGIPPCGIAIVPQSGLGEFSHTQWVMDLQEGLFKKDVISREEIADLGDTVYHEARHAEQFFRIVRYLAATGKSPKAIKKETGLPDRIIELGHASPLVIPESGHSREMAEAMQWHESIFGAKARERNESLLNYREIKHETFMLAMELQEQTEALNKKSRQFKKGRLMLKALADRYGGVKALLLGFGQRLLQTKTGLLQHTVPLEFKNTFLGLVRDQKQINLQLEDCRRQWGVLDLQSKQVGQEAINLAPIIKELRKRLDQYEIVQEIFYEEYRNLPEEQDAWEVGTRVSETLLSSIPEMSENEKLQKELEALFGFGLGDMDEKQEGSDSDEKEEFEPQEDVNVSLDLDQELEVSEPHPLDGPIAEIELVLAELERQIQFGMAVLTPVQDDDEEF
jgi:hypothetical protein